MTIDEAAKAISEQYRYDVYFQAVGVADDKLIVYLVRWPQQRKRFEEAIRQLAGTFPVTFKVTGRMRPAGET